MDTRVTTYDTPFVAKIYAQYVIYFFGRAVVFYDIMEAETGTKTEY